MDPGNQSNHIDEKEFGTHVVSNIYLEIILAKRENFQYHFGCKNNDEKQIQIVQQQSPFLGLLIVVAHHRQLEGKVLRFTTGHLNLHRHK